MLNCWLKKREGSIASGTFTGLTPEKTTFDELATGLLNDYTINGRKNLSMVETYLERLGKHFTGMRAIHVTTDKIVAYVADRKKQKTRFDQPPSNGTLNREMSALKRAFNLGKRARKVVSVPYIPMLKENAPRKGFFNHRDYLRLKKVLPEYLQAIVTLAYYTGMRKGEILNLLGTGRFP